MVNYEYVQLSFTAFIFVRSLITSLNQVFCETVGDAGLPHEHYRFKVAYDKLVIAAGSEPLTFGIKGVKEHAYFLREVYHAQEIRKKLLLNLMLSQNPGTEYDFLFLNWFLTLEVFRIIPMCATIFVFSQSYGCDCWHKFMVFWLRDRHRWKELKQKFCSSLQHSTLLY